MGEISEKVQENRLRWFNQVERRGEECLGRKETEIGLRKRIRQAEEMAALHEGGPQSEKADLGRSSKQSKLEKPYQKHRPHIKMRQGGRGRKCLLGDKERQC